MAANRNRSTGILLTGDYLHPDFGALRAFLATASGVEVREASVDKPCGGSHLIALCQSRPGQFTQEQVERLHACAPLASLLAILGSWCEGELRSGRPWHGVERVYWYDAVGRMQQLLDSDRKSPARTLTAAERIDRSVRHWPRAATGATAVIFALRRAEYEPLADICRVLGLAPRRERSWQAVGEAPTLLLAALDDLQASVAIEALGALCTAWPDARRIALLNFPRRNEVERLHQVGFDQVLGKPLLIADLFGCLPEMRIQAPQRQVAAS